MFSTVIVQVYASTVLLMHAGVVSAYKRCILFLFVWICCILQRRMASRIEIAEKVQETAQIMDI